MIRAYDKAYLGTAQLALAHAFDYAVYSEEIDLGDFCELFISSGVALRFQRGDARTLAGQSGVELAREALTHAGRCNPAPARYVQDRSPEYWAGWALAYYQWASGLAFKRILDAVPIDSVLLMYPKYHEMDILQFTEHMNELIHEAEGVSRLKEFRVRLGLSQRELAARANVPLRSIQQYEQRQKSINRASFETVLSLSQALFCSDPRDLLELDM